MALEKTLEINGLTVTNSYNRIDTVNGYKGSLSISVNTYASQGSFTSGTGYLKQKIYTFVPSVSDSAANFIKQGYIYLKTLDDFKDAADVLESGQTA